jgi:hypothetical protein
MLPQQHFDKTTIRSRAQGRKEAGPLASKEECVGAGRLPALYHPRRTYEPPFEAL